jgi:hypothetical protein
MVVIAFGFVIREILKPEPGRESDTTTAREGPIDRLCGLLADRPWEWTGKARPDSGASELCHTSGVWIQYEWDEEEECANVWVGHPGGDAQEVPYYDAAKLYGAVLACAVGRVSASRRTLWASAEALAKTVLEDHPDGLNVGAARLLAQEVLTKTSE